MNAYKQPSKRWSKQPSVRPRQSNEAGPNWLRRLGMGAALIVVAYVVVSMVEVWVAVDAIYETANQQADNDNGVERVAVVLGAAQYNGQPSPVLKARLDTAVRLYEQGHASAVVVTGGGQAGDVTTEAKTGYDYLRSAGVPDEDLMLEVQGASTYESLAATARFLRDDNLEHVIVVTDGFHIKRSLSIADEVGLDAVGVASTPHASVERIAREGTAVAVGRVVTFRRLQRILG